MRRYNWICCCVPIALALGLYAAAVRAQTTAFSYEGKLTDAGQPANSSYDLQFKLFDNATVGVGIQQGSTQVKTAVAASAGVFTVTLDFGASPFGGAARYLEVGVRPAGSAAAYTVIAPRQSITSAPYAIQTLNASQLGGLPASRYVVADDLGHVGIGTPPGTSRLEVGAAQDTLALVGSTPFMTFRDTFTGKNSYFQGAYGDLFLMTHNNQMLMLQDYTGNVGIGTQTPFSKVEILAQDGLAITGPQPYLTLRDTFGGSNKTSYMQGINGNAVLLTNSRAALVLEDVTGNVGLNTYTPAHHLDINGGPGWTSNGWSGAIAMSNASGIGWKPNAAGKSFGIGQSTGGLFFFNSASPPGNTASAANYLFGITDGGNITQALSGYALPKAMFLTNLSGAITTCYNGTTGGTGNAAAACGFVVTSPSFAVMRVNFGFPVEGRIPMTSCVYASLALLTNNNCAVSWRVFSTNEIEFFSWADGDDSTYASAISVVLF
jgi:hypothetical protein